jgi:hypothetical protein
LEAELQPDGLVRVDTEWFPCPDPKIGLSGHSFWVVSPRHLLEGKTVALGGEKKVVQPDVNYSRGFLGSGRETDVKLVFYENDPARRFSVFGERPEELSGVSVFAFAKQVRASVNEVKKTRKLRCYIDIRRGREAVQSADTLGGIDFQKIENLSLPDRSSKNLLRNPSFEQGFHEYFMRHEGYGFTPKKWETEPFAFDFREHVFGSRSLRIQTLPTRTGICAHSKSPRTSAIRR